MTDREKFLERWRGTVPSLAAQYTESFSGHHYVLLDKTVHECGIHWTRIHNGSNDAQNTAKEAWAEADAAMVEKFGEPKDPARDALVLKADALAEPIWQAREGANG